MGLFDTIDDRVNCYCGAECERPQTKDLTNTLEMWRVGDMLPHSRLNRRYITARAYCRVCNRSTELRYPIRRTIFSRQPRLGRGRIV